MPTGLALPPGVNSRGRARTVFGPAQTAKLLKIHCSPGDSTHPFEKIGIPNVTYAMPDQGTAAVRAYIESVYRRFAAVGRGKLLKEPTVLEVEKENERKMLVEWQSLEEPATARPRELTVAVPIGGIGR